MVTRQSMLVVVGGILLAAVRAWGQQEEVKIVVPAVDKAKGVVTLPGAFWNTHEADWVEVALCGRPSDFLHETVVSATTTRTLLEQALRDAGCRDGDAWADGVQGFAQVRGDQFMVLVDVSPGALGGKVETYSLDELMEFHGWGVSMGPFGFMFRGDPEHGANRPAAASLPADATDSLKIMRDDPQIALVFKGLQSRTQTFADHPLAYVEDGWLWEEINRDRNHSVLPVAVFDSNGKVPVTLRLVRVTEESLLTESAKAWHDKAFAQVILKQMETAKQIDKEKAEYWGLRGEAAKIAATKAELRDAEKELTVVGRSMVLAAEIGRDYAALDAAWTDWAAEHIKPEADTDKLAAIYKGQAARWRAFVDAARDEAAQVALAEEAAQERKLLVLKGAGAAGLEAKAAVLSGKELEARSRATLAGNLQSLDYWQAQLGKINDPKAEDVWAKSVRSQLALALARQAAGDAGAAFGHAEQTLPAEDAKVKELRAGYLLAGLQMMRAETEVNLQSVEFEISKREGLAGNDPELGDLKKEQVGLVQKIKELDDAIAAGAGAK